MHQRSEQNGVAPSPSAQRILDALTDPVAVLDQGGTIIAVNQAWLNFGATNEAGGTPLIGLNYLKVCERATGGDAPCARAAAAGIRSVLESQGVFSLEYPCHSPTQQRWFQLRASGLEDAGANYCVVAHHDITERMLLEQERQGLLARTYRHQEQLRALAAASSRIAAAGSPDATIQEATDQARLIIGAHVGATHTIPFLLWPNASVLVSVSDKFRVVPTDVVASAGAAIYEHVMRTACSLRLTRTELTAHPVWQAQRAQGIGHAPLQGVLAVPLTGQQGGTMGAIILSDKQHGEFSPDDEAILVQLAQTVSVALENAAQAKAQKESQDRLWATQEHANIGIGETDATGRFVTVNSGFSTITGYSRPELLSLSVFDLTPADDGQAERALYSRHVAGELKTYSLEKRYTRKDGSTAWLAVSATAVFDQEGRFRYSVRVIQDIDQRKRHEQRQALLVRELHHRVRNTLAVVQALAGATARSTVSIREFNHSFSQRLAALAKTQALLTEDYWQTAPLREMLLNELRVFGEGKTRRIRLEGPDVDLAADLAVPLSMALHELTANAARYGALSVRKGCVSVEWEVVTKEGRRNLHLRWTEQNGPTIVEPTHSGFGMTLLQSVLPAQCQAQVRLEFNATGFRFEMEAPTIVQRYVPEF
jgi:PAS domain S-box-containing protein